MGEVIGFVAASLGHAIELADLEKSAHVNRFNLTRLFKATTGVSPHRYGIARRVERARALVRERRLSLAQVAAASRVQRPDPPDADGDRKDVRGLAARSATSTRSWTATVSRGSARSSMPPGTRRVAATALE